MLPTKYLEINNDFMIVSTYREHAASYPLGPPPTHGHVVNYKGGYHLNKIPLFELDNNKLSSKCLVYHTPNKYVDTVNPTRYTVDEYVVTPPPSIIVASHQ